MAVVVSAMGGKPKVTDLLLNSVSLAAAGNSEGSEVCVAFALLPLYLPNQIKNDPSSRGLFQAGSRPDLLSHTSFLFLARAKRHTIFLSILVFS